MTGPFRDDTEAARLRADALEDELERERAKTEQLHVVEDALARTTAENERLRAENQRLKPRAAATPAHPRAATPSEPLSNAASRALWRRALDYVLDTLTDPGTDVSFGQLLIWWVVIALALGLVILVIALLS